MALNFLKKEEEKVDAKQVDKIVERVKKQYAEQGIAFEEVSGELGELKGIITEEKGTTLKVQKAEDLKEAESKVVSNLGNLYLKLGAITKPISNIISKLAFAKKLGLYLYSANMPYSSQQWIAITTIVSLVIGIISFIAMFAITFAQKLPMHLPVLIALLAFLFAMAVMLLIPKRQAEARGARISNELPFALRQMATELKAGIGFYRTMQTIATADYGALSEEFSRVIVEIEEGTDTKTALRRLALRTQSKALRSTLMHMIRALKTGGNLSEIMEEIASDVAFELRMTIRDFAQKMNFFGIIFIFAVIILPVFVGILGGIRNTPMQGISFESLPLTPGIIALIYLVIMPFVLILMFAYLMMMQPKT